MICCRDALLRLALFLFIIVCFLLYSTSGSNEEVFRDYSVDETLLEGSVEDEAAGPNQNSNVENEDLNAILSSQYQQRSSITIAPHEPKPVIIGESLNKLKDSEVDESDLDDESALGVIDEDYDHYDSYVEGEYEELPHCTEDNSNDSSSSRTRGVVVVSTLDGRISGVDALTGSIVWSHQTGKKQHQSMLSSSMSKMELTSRGDWVRLISSLDGGIYRFDGENVEALPVTAETLLHSSFKFNEDTIFTGGKLTEVLGIAADSGHLVYLCDDVGCKRQNMASRPSKVLVIRRITQTVRAIDPKNGSERWNFSVGHHELNLAGRGCESASPFYGPSNAAEKLPALHFVVPEGVVYAVDEDSNLIWKQKMSSPVVSAWKIVDGHPMQLDLFSTDTIPALGAGNFGQEEEEEEEEDEDGVSKRDLQPALYVGIHKKQLYIQQSGGMRKKMDNIVRMLTADQPGTDVAFPRVQWRPYLATALSRTPVVHHSHNKHPLLLDYEKKHHTTALTVKHKVDYPYDNGYYLYGDDVGAPLNDSEAWHNPATQEEPQLEEESILDVANHIYHVCFHVGPELWLKFAAVLLCYAFLHMLIIRYILNRMRRHLTRQAVRMVQQMLNNILQNNPTVANIIRGLGVDPNPLPPLEMPRESSSETAEAPSPPPIQDSDRTTGFTSRYLSDFEALHCLGRGGFGVVFHVRNRLDEVEYAVKRIPLPAKESSAERVKREVRALAKLNHTNIVRYYNSWLETPPHGWLEARDAWWKKGDVVSSSVFSPEVEEEEEEEGNEEYLGNVEGSGMDDGTLGLQLNPGLCENEKIIAEQNGIDKGRVTDLKQVNPPLFPSDFNFSIGRTEWNVDHKSSADNSESLWSSEEVSRVQSESNSFDIDFQDSCGKEDINIMGEDSCASENSFDIVFENTNEKSTSRSNMCVNSNSSDCDKVMNSRHIESAEAQSFSIVFENGEKNDSGQCLPEINKNNSSQGDENRNAVLQWRKEHGRTVSESSGIKFQKGKRRPTTLSLNEEDKGDSREDVRLRKTPVPKPRTLLYIQMELCRRESLRDWLKQNNNRELKTYSIFNDIVRAVEYVHDNQLMHRDLKPSNIFFSLDGEVKIGDFGLVTAITEENELRTPGDSLLKFPPGNLTLPQQQQLTKEVGTQLYMSPEQVNGLAYDYKVDIFSMGLIFFEMLVPFSTGMERLQVMQAVRERNFPVGFKEKFPDEHDLLVLMLSPNPKERPTTRGMRVRNPLRALQGESVNDIHADEHFRLSRSRSHTRSHSGSSFSFLSSSGSSLS